MKKRDLIVIAAVLASALTGVILAYLIFDRDAAHVSITVGDREPVIYPLEDRTVTIDAGGGRTNTVVITRDGVYMKEASCENRDCIEQGMLTAENCGTRLTGRFIICLPNRVTVELIE